MTAIKNLANIQTGIYAQPITTGEVYYIQARHFDAQRDFVETITPELPYSEKLGKHFLCKGDVLIAAKGYDYFAVAYEGHWKWAVASSIFIVLRPNTNVILPNYLAWFINHPKTQNILRGVAKGTNLPSITKTDIGDLNIILPTLARQEMILKIENLRKQEKQIIQKIENLREQFIQNSIFEAIKQEK